MRTRQNTEGAGRATGSQRASTDAPGGGYGRHASDPPSVTGASRSSASSSALRTSSADDDGGGRRGEASCLPQRLQVQVRHKRRDVVSPPHTTSSFALFTVEADDRGCLSPGIKSFSSCTPNGFQQPPPLGPQSGGCEAENLGLSPHVCGWSQGAPSLSVSPSPLPPACRLQPPS